MAAPLIDSLRACVSQRVKLYASVETLATLVPGDAKYDAYLAKHADAPDPTRAVRQEVDVKVIPSSSPLLQPSSDTSSSSQIDELNDRADAMDQKIDGLRAQLTS